MIKPEQVPDEVLNALLMSLRLRKGGKEAIAAALNAWPRMEIEMVGEADDFVILPLPQGVGDE